MPYITITPQTTITFYQGVNLNRNNTMTFASQDLQIQYFANKVYMQKTNCTYQRQTMTIIVESTVEEMMEVSYMSWLNTGYGETRTYYAFITGVEYNNSVSCIVTFSIDWWQTYLFDYSFGTCFVEREHVADDSVGAHIIDEGLGTGPYVTTHRTTINLSDWALVVETSVLFSGQDFPPADIWTYANITSGVALYVYDLEDTGDIPVILEALATAGKLDAVIGMYMVPTACIGGSYESGHPMPTEVGGQSGIAIPNNNNLDGYTPVNNKLLTYPYRALLVHNNDGESMELRYELLGNGATMRYQGSPLPNGRVICWPSEYEGITDNYSYSISLGDYPQCAWTGNVYANWYAYQAIRNRYAQERFWMGAITGGLQTAANGLAGQFVSGATTPSKGKQAAMASAGVSAGGLAALGTALDLYNYAADTYVNYTNLKSSMAEEREVHSLTPPSVRGSVAGNTNISLGRYGFVLEERTITAEYAKSIDGFFSMFGYKVNALKVPNINSRPAFNYLKCPSALIKGNIPTYVKAYMIATLDEGIWFWHSDNVGDYAIANK